MLRYIVRRLLISIPILLGVSIVTFTFANLAPGDPVSALMKPGTDLRPEAIEALRLQLGLDRPFHERYLAWLGQLIQGNLGVEAIGRGSIAAALARRVPNTVLLMGTALTISVILGVFLGIVSAFRQHTDGYVYAITFGRCQTDVDNQADEPFSRLYRMVPKD